MNERFLYRFCIPGPGLLIFVIILLLESIITADEVSAFSAEKAGFEVKFKDDISQYRVIGVFVLPGETLTLEVSAKKGIEGFQLRPSAGQVEAKATGKWHWQAPRETGLYPIKVFAPQFADSVLLNVFVMAPYERQEGEYLNGYRIGKYPAIPFRQLPIYKPPRGFIEVTEDNEETLVSPHFKLRQFLCKQGGGDPRYFVLRERLLLKLEMILQKLNEKGYQCETLTVMSGYRTPYYNKVIGNVKYSRHVWGGAADIFIDVDPVDDMMDDLNRDGKNDYRDAAILYDIIDKMYGNLWYMPFMGGLGRYKKTASHGPFAHVDVRGYRARWGS